MAVTATRRVCADVRAGERVGRAGGDPVASQLALRVAALPLVGVGDRLGAAPASRVRGQRLAALGVPEIVGGAVLTGGEGVGGAAVLTSIVSATSVNAWAAVSLPIWTVWTPAVPRLALVVW